MARISTVIRSAFLIISSVVVFNVFVPTAASAGDDFIINTNCSTTGDGGGGRVATSVDGKYVLFTSKDRVYVSRDYCQTSTLTPDQTSTGTGYTGIPRSLLNAARVKVIYNVSMSGNGQIQAVGTDRGGYVSYDFGATWRNEFGSLGESGWSVAISADGTTGYMTTHGRLLRGTNLLTSSPNWSFHPRTGLDKHIGVFTNGSGDTYWIRTETGLVRRAFGATNFTTVISGAIELLSFTCNNTVANPGICSSPSIAYTLSSNTAEVKVSSNGGSSWNTATYLLSGLTNTKKELISVDGTGTRLMVLTDGEVSHQSRNSLSSNFAEYFSSTIATNNVYADIASTGSGNRTYIRDFQEITSLYDATPTTQWNLTALARDGAADLEWNYPVAEFFPILGYVIRYSTDWTNWESVTAAANPQNTTISGLVNGNTYYLCIDAINKFGISRDTNCEDWGIKPFGTPSPPTISINRIRNSTITLAANFFDNGLVFQAIDFDIYDSLTNLWVGASGMSNKNANYTFTANGMKTGRGYYIKARVKYLTPFEADSDLLPQTIVRTAFSQASNSEIVISSPGKPKNLFVSTGDGRARINWEPPDFTGGEIAGYRVYLEDVFTYEVIGNAISSFELTNLVNNIVYKIGIKAFNTAGEGAIAEIDNIVPRFVPSLPETPTAIASYPSTGALKLSWVAPGKDGGSPISAYEVSYQLSNGTGQITTVEVSGNLFSHTFTGLSNYQSYTGWVRAKNGVGYGPRKTLSQPATPTGAPTSIVISTSAAGAINGQSFTTQPQITLLDDSGQRMTFDSQSRVHATLSTGASIIASDSATLTSGRATFSGLGIFGTAGNYHITYTLVIDPTAYASSSPIMLSETQTIVLSAGPAYALILETAGSGLQSGVMSRQPVIRIVDRGGNYISNGSSRIITASAHIINFPNEAPWCAPSDCQVTTTTSTATFTSLGFFGREEMIITYSSPDLISVSQEITPTAGAASQIGLTYDVNGNRIRIPDAYLGQEIGSNIAYRILDSSEFPVTNYSGTVTLSSNVGTLLGETTTSVINGYAIFKNIKIVGRTISPGSAEMVLLTASAPGLQAKTDSTILRNGSYTFTFMANIPAFGDQISSTISVSSDSATVTLPGAGALAWTGYTFLGWVESPTATTVISTITPDSDRTFYAKWGPLPSRTITPTNSRLSYVVTYGDDPLQLNFTASAGNGVGSYQAFSHSPSCIANRDLTISYLSSGWCSIQVVLTGDQQYLHAIGPLISIRVDRKVITVNATVSSRASNGTSAPGAVTVQSVSGLVGSDTLTIQTLSIDDAPSASPGNYSLFAIFIPRDSIGNEDFRYQILAHYLSFTILSGGDSFVMRPSYTGTPLKGSTITLTINTSISGKVRFFVNGKRIPNCLNRPTSGSSPNFSATCAWKPSSVGLLYISATLSPANGSAAVTSTQIPVEVLRRTGRR